MRNRSKAPGVADDKAGSYSPTTEAGSWQTWPAEQLWLWPGRLPPEICGRMRSVLADALRRLPLKDILHVAELADDDDPAAALRLISRLLNAQAERRQGAWELAATALWLAVVEYRDQRAAVEFAQIALRRAELARVPYHNDDYPSPLGQARRQGVRMRHQALRALTMAVPQSSFGSLLRDLAQIAEGDPIASINAAGQPRRGWDL